MYCAVLYCSLFVELAKSIISKCLKKKFVISKSRHSCFKFKLFHPPPRPFGKNKQQMAEMAAILVAFAGCKQHMDQPIVNQ